MFMEYFYFDSTFNNGISTFSQVQDWCTWFSRLGPQCSCEGKSGRGGLGDTHVLQVFSAAPGGRAFVAHARPPAPRLIGPGAGSLHRKNNPEGQAQGRPPPPPATRSLPTSPRQPLYRPISQNSRTQRNGTVG